MQTRAQWIVLGAILGLALVAALAASAHGAAPLADTIGPWRGLLGGFVGPDF